MSEREETIKVIGALAAAFPYAKIGEATIRIYAEALADIPPAILKAAGLACLSRATFFPAIAEIRTEAMRVVAPPRLPPEQAWRLVLEQVAEVHYDGTPYFADPVIAQVVAGVGWRDICMSEEPGVPRGQFYKLYAAAVERDRHDALLPDSVRQLAAALSAERPRQLK
jgi:hypothetical protein